MTSITGKVALFTMVAAVAAASVVLLLLPLSDAGAQTPEGEISVKSTGFGATYIVEFENNLGGGDAVSEIRMWLPEGGSEALESFKSDGGWTGRKNSAGVVVFMTKTPVMQGDTAKFGLVADDPKSVIGWRALDASGTELGIGVSEPEDLGDRPPPVVAPPPTGGGVPPPPQGGDAGANTPDEREGEEKGVILEASSIRLVPDNPRAGDTVRIVGAGFAADRGLELRIGGGGSPSGFETDPGGNFVITRQIPQSVGAARVDFAVTDSDGGSKSVSIRVGEKENRMASKRAVALAVNDVPAGVGRGDPVEITGTAKPSSTITVMVTGPEQNIMTSRPVQVDAGGGWTFGMHVPEDAVPGEYKAVVAGGTGTVSAQWTVEASRGFEMWAASQKYDPGEMMAFRGTATPGGLVEFMMKNPHGIEIFSDVKPADGSGSVEFSHETEQSSPEGTYVVTASHGDEVRTVLVGLGELPKDHIIVKMDKLNYKRGESPVISIDGPDSAVLSAFVIDQSDVEKFVDNKVQLGANGKLTYSLDLTDYSSGGYTLVLSRANTKTSTMFSVGLQVGAGAIEVGTTKKTYKANDPILVLGEAGSNILITMQLIDPDGNVVKEKETFTNKEGRISDGSFRIPSDAVDGIWTVKVSSGASFAATDLEVPAIIQEGLQVVFADLEDTATAGKFVNFKVFNARQFVIINVTSSEGKQVGAEIRFPASAEGETAGKWPVPPDLPGGTYTITASDAAETSRTEFVLKRR